MNEFGFRKLDVYQRSKRLVVLTYEVTRTLPEIEKYGLVSQMNRSSISISSNIAEGYSRQTNKDKCHFLNMAYSSLMELICQCEICHELGYINHSKFNELENDMKQLSIKLANFRNYIKSQ